MKGTGSDLGVIEIRSGGEQVAADSPSGIGID